MANQANETENIDYFGDYGTNSIDNAITDGPLYNPHSHSTTQPNNDSNAPNDTMPSKTISFDAAYNDYLHSKDGNHTNADSTKPKQSNAYKPFYNHSKDRYYRSKYHHSYRKRFRRISDMTMEERDQWEQIAQRNKRRRLNQDTSKYTDTVIKTCDINMESNMDALSCSDDDLSDSSESASFEAILFENDEQINKAKIDSLSSSEDEEDESKKKQKEAEKQNQIQNLIRIPKKMQSQRSHLDLIKAVRKSYRITKELPVLEDFTEQQNITKKRAKRAILQVMRENNLDRTMLRRRTKDTQGPRQLERQLDDSEDDTDDEEEQEVADDDSEMDPNDRKQLKLLNLPPDAGKYPFDSAVEKAMLRLLNRLKQFNPLFVDRPSRSISMDLSTMIDKVSMKAYNNVGIDFRYDFELMVESYREFYSATPGIVNLCSQLMTFGIMLIQKSDVKLVQRAKDKPMTWHLKQMMKQKRADNSKHSKNKKRLYNSDPVDIEGYWKIPYNKIKYKGDQSKLEKLDTFEFKNPFEYEPIFEYIPCVEPREQKLTMAKLKTSKKGCCDGKHCDDLSRLGPYDVHSMQFVTECEDRKHCMECSDLCGCSVERCANRSIQSGIRKVMGRDVKEELTFGMDQSTRRRITKTCMKECGFVAHEINKFIECVLQPSFNSFLSDCEGSEYRHLKSDKVIFANASLNGDTAPFFLTDVLKLLLAKKRMNANDTEMSRVLLSKIEKLANKRKCDFERDNVLDIGGGVCGAFCEEFYPIYGKGNGVICTDPNGVDINSFVIEYFGEVYPSWRWYEKCDLQKQVTMIVNGKYVIALFALKRIEYGQELTFDYNSVTESEQEYRAAICLCSQSKCRGTYLAYAGSNTYQQILSLYHNNLHRTACIFRACCDFDEDEEDDANIELKLKERHIGHSMLRGLPKWGRKWCYLITCFIEFEGAELPKELMMKRSSHETQQDIENEAYGVKQQRIQNVAVTVDKIKYVLRNQSSVDKSLQAPVRRLTDAEILNRLWNDANSLIHTLLRCLLLHYPPQNNESQIAINVRMVNEIESCVMIRHKSVTNIGELKPLLFEIRDKLRRCVSTDTCYFGAAADLLHLWANTKWFFAHNHYDSIKSAPFTLKELGFESDKITMNIKCQKPYGPLYIWAQMTFWFKQTVEKPDTSLAHCRRGSVYLPFIDCCFAKKLKHPIIKPYDDQTRNYWIQSLQDNAHSSWSNSLHWTYKGKLKTYGSPFLDHYLDETLNQLPRIIKELKQWNYQN
eukprot:1034081_1